MIPHNLNQKRKTNKTTKTEIITTWKVPRYIYIEGERRYKLIYIFLSLAMI